MNRDNRTPITLFLFLVFTLLLGAEASAQVTLARWTFLQNQNSGVPRAGVSLDTNVTVGDFRKSGALAADSSVVNSFMAHGWPLGGRETAKYFAFTVQADFGHRITYSSVSFHPIYAQILLTQCLWELRSSADNYSSALDMGALVNFNVLPPRQTANVSSLGTRQGAVEFRLYFYGNSGQVPDLRGVNDFVSVTGTVSPVPRIYPGTNEDFVTGFAVRPFGGALPPLAPADSRFPVPVAAGSDVVIQHVGATFAEGGQLLIVTSFTPTGTTVPSPFPGLWLDLNAPMVVLANDVFGNPLTLPPGGMSYAFHYGGSLAGMTGVLQALVVDQAAANGIFASTEGLELRFQ